MYGYFEGFEGVKILPERVFIAERENGKTGKIWREKKSFHNFKWK
jgi:hypothetical protein